MTEEPDIELLTEAYALLQADPGPVAITQLKRLAEHGSLMSMIYLAWVHKSGIGVVPDITQAEYWYRQAASGGSNLALYYLGHLYLDNKQYGKAEEVFSAGAELEYSPTIFCLGQMYLDGSGVPKDSNKALLLFKKAAGRGHVFAMRSLAAMYLSGRYGVGNIFKGLVLLCSAIINAIVISRADPDSDKLRA